MFAVAVLRFWIPATTMNKTHCGKVLKLKCSAKKFALMLGEIFLMN